MCKVREDFWKWVGHAGWRVRGHVTSHRGPWLRRSSFKRLPMKHSWRKSSPHLIITPMHLAILTQETWGHFPLFIELRQSPTASHVPPQRIWAGCGDSLASRWKKKNRNTHIYNQQKRRGESKPPRPPTNGFQKLTICVADKFYWVYIQVLLFGTPMSHFFTQINNVELHWLIVELKAEGTTSSVLTDEYIL